MADAATVRTTPETALLDLGGLPRIFWETSNDLFVVTDSRGVLRAANPSWHRTLGWSSSQYPRLRLRDLIHDDDLPLALENLGAQASGEPFAGLNLRLRTTDGDYREISWSGVSDGRFWYAAGRDLTDLQRAERAAREAAAFWQATIDSIRGSVAVLDDRGHIVAVNEAWREFGRRQGLPQSSPLGQDYLAACDRAPDEPGARRAGEEIRALLAGRRDPVVFDYALDQRWFTFAATPFSGEGPARIVITHTDVTERRRLEEEARAQSAVFDQFKVAVVGTDRDFRITRWSAGAEHLYGWSQAEALGRTVPELTDPRPVSVVERRNAVLDGRFELSRKDGTTFIGHLRWTDLHNGDGLVTGTLGIGMDVSGQDRAENDARAARHHLQTVTDSMTEGLFALDAEGGVTLMNRAAESMLGWSLDEIRGQRLHDITRHRRSDGTVHPADGCPIGGAREQAQVLQVDDDLFLRRDGVALPVYYTVSPLGSAESDGSVVVFMDATHLRAEQERMQEELSAVVWIQRVETALAEDRLLLYAQPIVALSSMSVTQHELLLRVVEKDGALSPPGDYLAIAEEYGLIGDIDRWVLRRAIDLAAAGHAVEVNVSAASVSDPAILADIEQWLGATAADPALLVFEITETAVITNEEAGRRFVERIHDLGCKVALDDFGTGHSGFAYLKQLPVDYLKIDIEFVHDLCHNPASRHVVEAVVNLARGFGSVTVAEGVEDLDTLDLLIALGVDYAQGYHLGRPAPLLPTLAPKHPEDQP
ncbi:EAL domain-containing protein [Nocardioides mesophilus]|uniref:EAL domain-containing protein n=1 Tax=Nocardioides mesophilus TaxID=433659 RepID=A0A7G9R832_9ACTN|nr:EAL domain-containing protein [Nocardioides mesophilus]QNN51757.1 EAL domain-containing protein [Nocardioides mesophilus]